MWIPDATYVTPEIGRVLRELMTPPAKCTGLKPVYSGFLDERFLNSGSKVVHQGVPDINVHVRGHRTPHNDDGAQTLLLAS